MASAILTLLTDFGLKDSYAAEMKGVLLSLAPEAVLVDISHQVPPQDVARGAYLLARAFHRFPAGTVHLAVVDPGVGTERRGIVVRGGGYTFVAPDNGLLTLALDRLELWDQPEREVLEVDGLVSRRIGPRMQAIHLTRPDIWLPAVSRTFHGRDVFAPVAARLACGASLAELGEGIDAIHALPRTQPIGLDDGGISARVLAVDHFGNLAVGLREGDLPGTDVAIEVAGRRIVGLSPTYGAGRGLVALIGSDDYLELAYVNGNAARELSAGVGTEVVVRPNVSA